MPHPLARPPSAHRNALRILAASLALVGAAACEPTLSTDVTPKLAAPSPGALPVDPPIQCQEQQPADGTPIVVHGSGFAPIAVDIPNAPKVVLPDLTLVGAHDLFGAGADVGNVLYSGTAGGDNAALLSWQSSEQLTFVMKDAVRVDGADGAIPAGLFDVEVKNADGQGATSSLSFAVTERPAVASLAPPFTCLEQGARSIVVTGTNALRIADALPVVNVGGVAASPTLTDCSAIAHPGLDAELCSTLTIELAQSALPSGAHAVSVHNPEPAACVSTDVVDLVVVPPPAIDSIDPPTVCDAEAGILDLTVHGSGFLRADGSDFAVSVGGTVVVPTSISDCTVVAVVGADVQTCNTFVVSVDTAAFPVGQVEVTLTNPAPADCSVTTSSLFEILPSPAIDDVAPPNACSADGGVDLTVTGSSFLRNGATDFTATVGGLAATPTAISGCTSVTVQGVVMDSCTSFVVNVDPALLPSGPIDVAVLNPAPDSCATSRNDLFEVLPSPTIASVAPPSICSVGAGVLDLAINGADFLRDGVNTFTVTVGGATVVPTAITGCTAVTVEGQALEACTDFVVTVDTSTIAIGPVPIVVTNPAPDGCIGSTSAVFEVLPPPTVTAVVPGEVCSDVASSLEVQGTGFGNATTVTFNGVAPDTVTLNGNGNLDVTFASGLPAGTYDVTVSNGAGCESTLVAGLIVHPTPLVFFVDPPVIFNGVNFEATLFVSGVDADVAAVSLIDGGGAVIPVTTFASPDRPQRILATLEAGLAPGDYEVAVTSADGCPSALNGSLHVTDQTTLTIDSVDPLFVSPTVPTAVTVISSGAVPFTNLPRVYLNPTAGGNAVALRAVELTSPTQLSAIVTGAAPGSYQLIVVNPTGEVGIAPDPVEVTVLEPPLVTSLAPASLDAGSVSAIAIGGANFEATTGPVVTLDCRDFATGADVPDGTATVDAATATSLDVTVDATPVPAGAVCVVIVTNPDNASFRFSALSFKNPAQNLNAFTPGSSMVEARRGLVLAAGRPTETSRFLYAVGGDAGAVATAKTSVEAVTIDPFGAMGTWALQRNSLANAFDGTQQTPLPRTLAGTARIGRFIYVVGGNNGAGPVNTVMRAQILDPLAGPEVFDLDATLGDGVVGMPEGLFLYRVSALFPNSDASNPGGESLAGELFNVDVPVVADKLVLTLSWLPVQGASAYRVYRTPVAGQTPAELELLAEVAGTTFVDDNSRTPDPTTTPMPSGSLGVWHALTGSPLSIPRESAATVAVPSSTPGRFFLYAVGGATTGGTVLASGEFAAVTVAADGSQTVSAFGPLTATLNPARKELVGMAIANTDTPVAAGNTFLFFSSGRRQNNSVDNTVQGAAIAADGNIAAFTVNLTDPNPARVGAAGLSANGFLYLFGGANGSPSNNDVSAVLEDATPTLSNWNGLGGGGMLIPRVLLGAAQESAFFFVGGGVTSGDVPTATIDQTVQ